MSKEFSGSNREQKLQTDRTNDIFVGNIPSVIDDIALFELFRGYRVLSVSNFTRQGNKVFAFLRCVDQQEVARIVGEMNNHDVEGRRLKLRACDRELQAKVEAGTASIQEKPPVATRPQRQPLRRPLFVPVPSKTVAESPHLFELVNGHYVRKEKPPLVPIDGAFLPPAPIANNHAPRPPSPQSEPVRSEQRTSVYPLSCTRRTISPVNSEPNVQMYNSHFLPHHFKAPSPTFDENRSSSSSSISIEHEHPGSTANGSSTERHSPLLLLCAKSNRRATSTVSSADGYDRATRDPKPLIRKQQIIRDLTNLPVDGYYSAQNSGRRKRYNSKQQFHRSGVEECHVSPNDEEVSDEGVVLCVANFPFYTSELALFELFEDYDPIGIDIVQSEPTGNRDDFTYALVTVPNQEIADSAIFELDNTQFRRRSLVVQILCSDDLLYDEGDEFDEEEDRSASLSERFSHVTITSVKKSNAGGSTMY